MDLIGFNNFLLKIDTYKINNQLNIKAIENKSQIEINYIAQLIINQILSDEIKKKTRNSLKEIQL
jgi:hypothetical protein